MPRFKRSTLGRLVVACVAIAAHLTPCGPCAGQTPSEGTAAGMEPRRPAHARAGGGFPPRGYAGCERPTGGLRRWRLPLATAAQP